MGREGFEPTKACADRFTVCCNSPTLPSTLNKINLSTLKKNTIKLYK